MRRVIHECRKICRDLYPPAKVYFIRLKNTQAGYCDYENSSIYINSSFADRNLILSVLFHELAHLECYKNYKWNNYHRAKYAEDQVNCGLKAERYCDRWAEMELYKYDKRVRFVKSYNGDNKELREFLRGFFEGKGEMGDKG